MACGMSLLRKLFWFGIYLISTLSFIVLFENGTTNFSKNLGREITELRTFVNQQIDPKKTPQ